MQTFLNSLMCAYICSILPCSLFSKMYFLHIRMAICSHVRHGEKNDALLYFRPFAASHRELSASHKVIYKTGGGNTVLINGSCGSSCRAVEEPLITGLVV